MGSKHRKLRAHEKHKSKANRRNTSKKVSPWRIDVSAVWDEQENDWKKATVSTDFTVRRKGVDLKTFSKQMGLRKVSKKENCSSKEHESPKSPASRSGDVRVKVCFPPVGKKVKCFKLRGRILACLCRSMNADGKPDISVTMRVDGDSAKTAEKKILKWLRGHHKPPSKKRTKKISKTWDFEIEIAKTSVTSKLHQKKARRKSLKESQSISDALHQSLYRGPDTDSEKLPVSIKAISHSLHETVFFRPHKKQSVPNLEQMHGAILIAGRTKSAKSLITRALIHHFVSQIDTYRFLHDHHGRNPHLVTCEDPIEASFYPTKHSLERPVDYTPRDKTEGDYHSLKEAFEDALRQTPACMFIGEVRDRADLEEVINFGGTGHLVVATLHAGSLHDIFTKVFEATDVKNSAARGLVGNRVLAAIHLKQLIVDGKKRGSTRQVVVPTVWRRTAASTAALVASGIGSLTPNLSESHACLGRQFFARKLLRGSGDRDLQRSLEVEARAHDLRGE